MSIEISSAPSLSKRCQELDLDLPDGLSLLPENLETAQAADGLLYSEITPTLRKLLRKNGVEESSLGSSLPTKTVHRRSADWVLPTLFVGNLVLSSNPHMISLALNVIGNYVSTFLQAKSGTEACVSLDVIIERDSFRSSTKVSYRGEASGLSQIAEIVESVKDE